MSRKSPKGPSFVGRVHANCHAPALDSLPGRQAPMPWVRGQTSPTEKSVLAATPKAPNLRRSDTPPQFLQAIVRSGPHIGVCCDMHTACPE